MSSSPKRLWRLAAVVGLSVLVGAGLQAAAQAATPKQAALRGTVTPATLPFPSSTETVFHALTPARILDTRSTTGGHHAKFAAGETFNLQVTGVGGVPAGASSVAFNLTVTGGSAGSFLTAWPQGVARPSASTINFDAGATLSNFATVGLSGSGKMSIFNLSGTVDVIVDVTGYYSTSTFFGSAGYVGWIGAGDSGPIGSHSSNGQAISFVNNSVGNDTVTFHGANIGAFIASAGVIEVSVAGTNTTDTCVTLAGTGNNGLDLNVTVDCSHSDGSAANDIWYLMVSG